MTAAETTTAAHDYDAELAAINAHDAECVRRERQARGWSQRELADRMGKPQSTIADAEKPTHELRGPAKAAFAAAFGVTIIDLFLYPEDLLERQ